MSKCAAFVCGFLTALVVSVLVVQVILARFGKIPNPMPPVVVDADGKFYVCCMALGIENKVEMCVYPPPSSPSQAAAKELVSSDKKWNGYWQCYANHKNNRACCESAGVTKCKDCQPCADFCDGTKKDFDRKNAKKYYPCAAVTKEISTCNKASYMGNVMKTLYRI